MLQLKQRLFTSGDSYSWLTVVEGRLYVICLPLWSIHTTNNFSIMRCTEAWGRTFGLRFFWFYVCFLVAWRHAVMQSQQWACIWAYFSSVSLFTAFSHFQHANFNTQNKHMYFGYIFPIGFLSTLKTSRIRHLGLMNEDQMIEWMRKKWMLKKKIGENRMWNRI